MDRTFVLSNSQARWTVPRADAKPHITVSVKLSWMPTGTPIPRELRRACIHEKLPKIPSDISVAFSWGSVCGGLTLRDRLETVSNCDWRKPFVDRHAGKVRSSQQSDKSGQGSRISAF